jgi:hypothetical protein
MWIDLKDISLGGQRPKSFSVLYVRAEARTLQSDSLQDQAVLSPAEAGWRPRVAI